LKTENNTGPYQLLSIWTKNSSATSLVNIMCGCMDQPTPFTTANY